MKNYRPVALLCVMSKICEKVLCNQLLDHLNTTKIISERQYGSRKGRSAADLHLLLMSRWSSALDKGLKTIALAIDIDGAFDRVWHEGLLTKLRSMGVTGNALSLLRDYLTGRHLKVVINGYTSEARPICAGIPQGSVLGPLLWLVMSNDMIQMLPEADAFVDDVTLSKSYQPHQEREVISQMEGRLILLQRWGQLWQIRFVPHKTQLLVIWRPLSTTYIRFGQLVLKSSESIDVLGLIYDKALTFHQHLLKISKKAAGKLASLRRVSGLMEPKDLETLYKAQIRSVLEFAPLAWGGASPTHLALLDKVQRRAERIIYGDAPSSLQPLQQRRDVAGMTTMFKIQELKEQHLQVLRQPPRPVPRLTREAAMAEHTLALPRCHTLHHQRQFVALYTRKWNEFIMASGGLKYYTLQSFKCAANRWLSNPG